jgi:hypothetical protein
MKNCLAVAVHCRNQNVSRKTTPKSDLLKRVSYIIFNIKHATFPKKASCATYGLLEKEK